MEIVRSERKKLKHLKKTIDFDMSILHEMFEMKENLKSGWHVNALTFVLRVKQRLIVNSAHFVAAGVATQEACDQKLIKLNEMTNQLLIMSETHFNH